MRAGTPAVMTSDDDAYSSMLTVRPWVRDVTEWRRANEQKASKQHAAAQTAHALKAAQWQKKSVDDSAAAPAPSPASSRPRKRAPRRPVPTAASVPPTQRVYKYQTLDRDEIHKLYFVNGMSHKETAVALGVSGETLTKAMRFYDMKARPQPMSPERVRPDTPELRKEVIDLYHDGYSIKDIEVRSRVSTQRARRMLEAAGVPLRKPTPQIVAELGLTVTQIRTWALAAGVDVAAGNNNIAYRTLKQYLDAHRM